MCPDNTVRMFPVVLMNWIEGETLKRFVYSYFHDNEPKYHYHDFGNLALNFIDLANWICQQDFAHGDIQPNNILITKNGQIVLLDYDNMFVHDISGTGSIQTGNQHYIHPDGNLTKSDSSIDDFPLTVIAFSLCALAVNEKVHNIDFEDALVLSNQDYLQWVKPELMNKLGLVLHDPICASLFSAISDLIANRNVNLPEVFSLKSRVSSNPPIYLPFKLGKNGSSRISGAYVKIGRLEC